MISIEYKAAKRNKPLSDGISKIVLQAFGEDDTKLLYGLFLAFMTHTMAEICAACGNQKAMGSAPATRPAVGESIDGRIVEGR